MSEYQAVYDAVRSRIHNCDVGAAVEIALREANLSHYADMASRAAQEAAQEAMRPCVMFRPAIMIDGDHWCALYGDDLQCGVAGFGKSPALAMRDFDTNWFAAPAQSGVYPPCDAAGRQSNLTPNPSPTPSPRPGS